MRHRDIFSLHGLIADEFLDDLLLWPDSHMSDKDISSLSGLISDESSLNVYIRLPLSIAR